MYPQNFRTKQIHMTIAADLLDQIDDIAIKDFTTRSSIFRIALLEYVRKSINATKLQAQDEPGRDVELKKIERDNPGL
jgi:metal-responsive CopG/Arc/MetJ family transcriptional regulator